MRQDEFVDRSAELNHRAVSGPCARVATRLVPLLASYNFGEGCDPKPPGAAGNKTQTFRHEILQTDLYNV